MLNSPEYMEYNCGLEEESETKGGAVYFTAPGSTYGPNGLPDDAEGTRLTFTFYAIDYSEEGVECIVDELEEVLSHFKVFKWFHDGLDMKLVIYATNGEGEETYWYEPGVGFVLETGTLQWRRQNS